MGFPMTHMNSMVHGTHLGVLLCPKSCFFIISRQFPDFQENWEGPWALPVYLPITPLEALYAAIPELAVRNSVLDVGPWL